jgi:hypothetical protein
LPSKAWIIRLEKNTLDSAMMLSLKATRIIGASTKLITDLAQRYPRVLENELQKTRNPDRIVNAFDGTFNRAIEVQCEHNCGVHGKARLGNMFR